MISVVVPAHNAAGTLRACLDGLARQTLPSSLYEVIVVDDGSTDGTAHIAAAAGARVICLDHHGAAAARNAGIAASAAEFVCFTDADCVPAPEWLAAITAPFTDAETIGCKGVYRSRQRQLAARFVQIEYEDKYDLLRQHERIDFIDTYSAAYRRAILVANNGFDARIRFVEDQELSFRLAARGYKMVFAPEAAVEHRHSDTAAGYFRKKFNIGFWKSQIVRRFPGRGVKDSHTPQVLKVQMLLVALTLAAAAGAAVLPELALVAAGGVVAFLLTTAPFVAKAWPKDRQVAAAAPWFLFLRALALGVGYGWGLVRPQPGMSGEQTTIGGLNYLLKRLLDVAGSLMGLLFAAAASPFIVAAIKLTSPGPALFRQVRVGLEGRPFVMYKFRSMLAEAERELPRYVDLDALPEPVFKLADDPRVTPVGRFLRRWSLDELPQFWNVLRGDMSLIGPRPEEPWLVERYSDWHRRRLAIRPGMTGPMQVNGRADLSLDERVRLELDYIENYSLAKDALILARTVPAIARGDGAR